MTNLGIIGAAALSLVLAGPAIAAGSDGYRMHHAYQTHYARVIHRMPAQDFNHLDLGIARQPIIQGGRVPMGDGDYPGTVGQNMGPPSN